MKHRLVVAALAASLGCSEATAPQPGPATSINIEFDSAVVLVDSTVVLTAVVLDSAGRPIPRAPIAWFSFDDSVVSVAPDGAATGHRVGLRRIMAASGDVADTATVTVVTRYVSIEAGRRGVCGITTEQRPVCWPGPDIRHPQPAPAEISTAPDLIAISVAHHACGLALDGHAWCWGSNRYGELGRGDTTASNEVITVANGRAYSSIEAGAHFTCARVASGEIDCWGNNSSGQLGTGATGIALPMALQRVPSAVGPSAALSAGDHHACRLDASGTAFCWGFAAAGQLGFARPTNIAQCDPHLGACTPTEGAVEGGHTFTTIAAGAYHTCAADRSGQAWCWGYNSHGQLGTPAQNNCWTSCPAAPVAVQSSVLFSSLAVGYQHSCGLEVDGRAWCWGERYLGNGLATGSSIPVEVSGGHRFAMLTATEDLTCGLSLSGIAWCWGQRATHLGGSESGPALVPRRVLYQP